MNRKSNGNHIFMKQFFEKKHLQNMNIINSLVQNNQNNESGSRAQATTTEESIK